MTTFCVPYYNSNVASQYRLYTVAFEKKEIPSNWNVNGLENEPSIAKKISGLQEFFEKRHYSRKYPGQFQMEALDKTLSAKDKYQIILNEQTPSVFLGLFLKAAEQIQRYEFKSEWQIICVTGDVKYDGETGKLSFVSVSEIDKKFSGEFVLQADNNKQENYLFLYIGDKEYVLEGEKQGKHGNITVKKFSPDNEISDIIDYIFKPITFDFNFDDFEPQQQKLLSSMENENGIDFGYIPGEGFDDFVRTMMYDQKWRGFFIHGEGGRGKSAAAMALARYLTWVGKIYAPVWIRINNDEINKLLDKEDREIDTYLFSRIGTFKNELPENQYLIVIDNLELRADDISRVLSAIQKIFYNVFPVPYLIITSRIYCDVSQTLRGYSLQDKDVPMLKKEQVAAFVKNIAGKKGNPYNKKIDDAEKTDKFNRLSDIFFEKFANFPELIILSISLLRHLSVTELVDVISTKLGEKEDTIRNKRIQIYKTVFSFLTERQKQVLYLFLEIGEDNPFSVDDIYNKIGESEHWREIPLSNSELTEILRGLFDYNLLYTTDCEIPRVWTQDEFINMMTDYKIFRLSLKKNIFTINSEGKTLYGIKNVAYYTFLLENEFLHSKPGVEDFMRDNFVDLDLQLEKALEYDQDKYIIKRLLEKRRAKCSSGSEFKIFSVAVRHSTDPEILSLFKHFNLGFNDYCDPFMIFSVAAENGNIKILDWLFNNNYSDLLKKKNKSGKTVLHSIVSIVNDIAVLDWFLEKVPEQLRCVDEDRRTVFHYVASNKNIAVIDKLFMKVPDLLESVDQFECTVAHIAAQDSNTAVLDWLSVKSPELLKYIDENGETVFHAAVKYWDNTALNCLLQHIPELLMCKTNSGETVFHIAAKYNNYKIMDWLFTHAQELLDCKDNNGWNVFQTAVKDKSIYVLDWLFEHAFFLLKYRQYGRTIFHFALMEGNHILSIENYFIVLNWLFEYVPELLKYSDNSGQTVFHYAVQLSDIDVIVLDWLFKHAPELLGCKDNNGQTVFHCAARKGNINIFDWLVEHEPNLLDCKDDDGNTILHTAVKAENIDVIDWIIEHSPKLINYKNNDGKTAYYYAKEKTSRLKYEYFNWHDRVSKIAPAPTDNQNMQEDDQNYRDNRLITLLPIVK